MQYIIKAFILFFSLNYALYTSEYSTSDFFVEKKDVETGSSASISSGCLLRNPDCKHPVIFKQFYKKIDENFVQKEFSILETLFHSGALVPKPYCLEQQKELGWQIIMEDTGISLSQVDLSIRNISFRHELILHLIEALESVHAIGYVHGDLSPNNITIKKKGFIQQQDRSRYVAPRHIDKYSVKLIDFGNTYRDGERYSLFSTTPLYGAPERYGEGEGEEDGYIAQKASDIFSLAVIVFKLYFTTGKEDALSLIERIARKKITNQYMLIGYMATSYAGDYEKEVDQRRTLPVCDPLSNLLRLSMHPDPKKRPSIQEFREEYIRSYLSRKRYL